MGDIINFKTIMWFISVIYIPLIGWVYVTSQRKNTRKWLQKALDEDSLFLFYKKNIRKFLEILQYWYGKPFSYLAISRSMAISYFYPIVFFIISYSFFQGSNKFANIELFPNNTVSKALPFILALYILGILYLNKQKDFIVTYLLKNKIVVIYLIIIVLTFLYIIYILSNDKEKLIEYFSVSLIFFLSGHICFYLVVSRYYKIHYNDYIIITVNSCIILWLLAEKIFCCEMINWMMFLMSQGFTITVSVLILYKPNLKFIIHLNLVIVFCLVIYDLAKFPGFPISNKLRMPTAYLFFFVLLPLLNTLFDTLSLATSRIFLEKSINNKSVSQVIIFMFLNLIFACFFLLSIAISLSLLAIIIEIIAVKIGYPININWEQYAIWARDEPFRKGIFVTSMLISTLIPTIIHITISIFSIIVHFSYNHLLAKVLRNAYREDNKIFFGFFSFLTVSFSFISIFLVGYIFIIIYSSITNNNISEQLYNFVKFTWFQMISVTK